MKKKTDLNKCKEIAKWLLRVDIVRVENVPIPMITHPFFDNEIVFDENKQSVNILEDKVAYEKEIKRIDKQIDSVDNYLQFIFLIRSPYRIYFLDRTKEFLEIRDFSIFLMYSWINDEFASRNANVSKDDLVKLFKMVSKTYLMCSGEKKVYNELDEVVTIYRGVRNLKQETIKGLSWTLSLDVAKVFASRWTFETGGIYKAKIKKQDILAYCNEKDEQEIIVDYKKLYDITLIEEIDNSWKARRWR